MSKVSVGIDFGGTAVKFTVLGEDLRPRPTFQLPTPNGEGADAVIAQMVRGAREAMAREQVQPSEVVGVGIGSPGPLDISGGMLLGTPNIPGMRNVPLRDRVAEGLNLPAALENDANAAALGEYICGAGRDTTDMCMLTLGTGVGSGIVHRGQIVHGAHEMGAEFGHMIVQPRGRPCGCGQAGCLERYASATYLARNTVELLEADDRPSLLREVLAEKGAIDAKDINNARRAGDALAAEAWDQCAYYIALGCVNICRILDPDRIVLAGGMVNAGDDLLRPVREHLDALHWTLTERRTRLSIATLGSDAGAIGAAGVAWTVLGRKDLSHDEKGEPL